MAHPDNSSTMALPPRSSTAISPRSPWLHHYGSFTKAPPSILLHHGSSTAMAPPSPWLQRHGSTVTAINPIAHYQHYELGRLPERLSATSLLQHHGSTLTAPPPWLHHHQGSTTTTPSSRLLHHGSTTTSPPVCSTTTAFSPINCSTTRTQAHGSTTLRVSIVPQLNWKSMKQSILIRSRGCYYFNWRMSIIKWVLLFRNRIQHNLGKIIARR